MNKNELIKIGISYVTKFCEINNIEIPKINIAKNDYYGSCGYYIPESKTITIIEKACARETNKPGFSWSHRHYFVDREPCGVLCHEFGHYLHDILTNNKLVLPKERNISSYEPNHYERFAETIKLFILNPDLLKEYDPKRYEVITKQLGLKPIFHESWEELMKKEEMNPKFIQATKNRLAKL